MQWTRCSGRPACLTIGDMAGDVGSYFKKLTSKARGKARGGRRRDEQQTTKPRKTSKKRRPRTRNLPPEGVVAVEYSPRIDGDPDPGEVVWTWVPFEEDPEQGKDRPVIVIGRRGPKMVGVPLTTKRSEREAQVAIGTGDWDPAHRQSYARIWRVVDFDGERMRREGAILARSKFDRVVEAVDEYYEVRFPTADKQD